jgi:uncharacterized protein with PIN domain
MKFLLDQALGGLCKWLRILGYDAVFLKADPDTILRKAQEEGRIIITRTKRLFEKIKGKGEVHFIRENKPLLQLKELMGSLDLKVMEEALFSRCLLCNEELKEASPQEVKDRVPDFIFKTHTRFSECPKCHKVFWGGSHYERMIKTLKEVFGEDNWR